MSPWTKAETVEVTMAELEAMVAESNAELTAEFEQKLFDLAGKLKDAEVELAEVIATNKSGPKSKSRSRSRSNSGEARQIAMKNINDTLEKEHGVMVRTLELTENALTSAKLDLKKQAAEIANNKEYIKTLESKNDELKATAENASIALAESKNELDKARAEATFSANECKTQSDEDGITIKNLKKDNQTLTKELAGKTTQLINAKTAIANINEKMGAILKKNNEVSKEQATAAAKKIEGLTRLLSNLQKKIERVHTFHDAEERYTFAEEGLINKNSPTKSSSTDSFTSAGGRATKRRRIKRRRNSNKSRRPGK